MINYPLKEKYTAEDLVEITRLLRDPENGCPWDKVQTHQSIRKNFLEETYEVLEAIDVNSPELLSEELGDVMMQVALHACMEQERGNFDFSDVCKKVCEKLITRHPHVFSNAKNVKNEIDGLNSWETLKNKEKGRKTIADELSSVPITLPALMKAQKTQKRAAAYKSDLSDEKQVFELLEKDFLKFKEQINVQGTRENEELRENAGKLLLSLTNTLRLANIDAEETLQKALATFAQEVQNI